MKILSHYTSERSLIGIVRSQSMWATDFLALNDSMEFIYALSAIYEEAHVLTLSKIPDEARVQMHNQLKARFQITEYIDALKKQVAESDGYGSIYVTSFARGKNDDEDDRGILTLWDRYTDNEGYCVQFEEQSLRRLVDNEGTRHSYAWIELAEVQYGIDRQGSEFRGLAEQLSLRMLLHLFHETGDQRLTLDLDKRDADSYFFQKLLSYCGKHKDPAFEDEREIRIFSCPANISEPRVLTGIASPKTIYRRANEPSEIKYIILGENLLPGLIPNRIVIGPKAELPGWMLDGLYPQLPVIKKSTIPIR